MSVILNIDTALSTASVSLSKNEILLSHRQNDVDRDHAAWLHVAISELFRETRLSPSDLDAVAISHGPGSYTGLRIGMAAAKGFCFTLNIPLITISTLEIMAIAGVELIPQSLLQHADLLCPMIDARRKEVYMGIFDPRLKSILPPTAVILNEFDFDKWLLTNRIIFFGNGSKKFRELTSNKHAFFTEFDFAGAVFMIKKSWHNYDNGIFADLALSEPLYIKEFYDTKL